MRRAQAAATRDRILASIADEMAAGGLPDFSIPQVAARAGVAERTVYRYFPTRKALFEGLADWYSRTIAIPFPRDLDALVEAPVPLFELMDRHAALVLAVLNTQVGAAIRGPGRARRRERLQRLLREVTGRLEASERRKVAAVVNSLLNSQMWKAMREEWRMTGTEAGRAVSWALRVLLEDVRRRARRR